MHIRPIGCHNAAQLHNLALAWVNGINRRAFAFFVSSKRPRLQKRYLQRFHLKNGTQAIIVGIQILEVNLQMAADNSFAHRQALKSMRVKLDIHMKERMPRLLLVFLSGAPSHNGKAGKRDDFLDRIFRDARKSSNVNNARHTVNVDEARKR